MITEKVSGGQSFLASIQNLLIFAIFKSSSNLNPIRHWSENWCPGYLEHALCSSEIHLAAAKSLEIIGHVTNCCKRPIISLKLRKNSDNRNSHDDQTDETSWYCAKCLSLPFSNLVDPDFYKEINSNGNPQINDLTLLTKTNDSKSGPFSFSDNCDDDEIDPDNYLTRQTTNNDRCFYYTEESFNHLLKDKKIKK